LTTGFLFAKMKTVKKIFLRGKNFSHKNNMNKELVEYIQQQLSLSVSKNKIIDVLLEQGWHQAEIDEAFLDAEGAAIRGGQDFSGDASLAPARDGGGSGKKILLVAGLGALAMLIVVAAVLAITSGRDNSKKPAVIAPVEPEVVNNDTPVVEDEPAPAAQNQIDPALLADISRLEQTITPPAGWTSRQGVMSYRPMAAFFKPEWEKDAAGNNLFNENISVVRDNLLSDEKDYVAKAKTVLQTNMTDYKIISERKVNLPDGSSATLLGGSFTQNDLAMKNMQLYASKNGRIYIITGVTLAKNWDAEKDMIGAAVMSFRFPEN